MRSVCIFYIQNERSLQRAYTHSTRTYAHKFHFRRCGVRCRCRPLNRTISNPSPRDATPPPSNQTQPDPEHRTAHQPYESIMHKNNCYTAFPPHCRHHRRRLRACVRASLRACVCALICIDLLACLLASARVLVSLWMGRLGAQQQQIWRGKVCVF